MIKQLILILSICLLASSSFGADPKSGPITQDETWSGEIFVSGPTTVEPGITLTIKPGTVVKFAHCRGYKGEKPKGALMINGGTIKAVGTADKQIWFTSDATSPINGDWEAITVIKSKNSILKYCIVEYAEIGIEQYDSDAIVSHSIIRWNNTEGLYAERSKPTFEYNTLYDNAYHEIALEQYNRGVRINNNLFSGGTCAIHMEETHAEIYNNTFKNYREFPITAWQESKARVKDNKFQTHIPRDIFDREKHELFPKEQADLEFEGNILATSLPSPKFDYQDVKKHVLNYKPGSKNDRYPYIFPEEDRTRRVIKKIGVGQGFAWTITYAKGSLWRFIHKLQEGHESLHQAFIKVNPQNGKIEKFFPNDAIINPRGLTFDGKYFWTNDFSGLKIYQFTTDGDKIKVLKSFDIPEKEKGGINGLACDGTYLYYHSRDGRRLFKLDMDGKIVSVIKPKLSIGGPFVWTGKYFWAAYGNRGIGKLTAEGELVGGIYAAANGTWAIDFDGKYLWTVQKTCELWDDAKIYQIEILDDSMKR